jgi:gliding motility-associated-like protein
MRKTYYSLLLLIVFCLVNKNSFASHASGGQLIYRHISGNDYEFIFKYFNDCSLNSINEPASFPLCYTNSCTGQSYNATMNKVVGNISTIPPTANGTPLDNGCGQVTACDDPNSTIHGYRQWWYSVTITLPSTCNAWRFWTSICCRNGASGNITTPGSQDLYIEATFDNTVSVNNSSPEFINSNTPSKLPNPYVCVNLPYLHNGGAFDSDGDSLVFTTIQPRDNPSGCTPTGVQTGLLLATYNTNNVSGDPFPTTNTYNLNTTNGFFGFTPNQNGIYVLCIKVSEYRNGTLIGSVMRDMQVIVDDCLPIPVIGSLDPTSLSGGNIVADTIYTCPGSNLDFCFDIEDLVNTQAHLYSVGDNHSVVMPGSTISFSYPDPLVTSKLRVCITWTSNLSDTNAVKIVSVDVEDTTDCAKLSGNAKTVIKVLKTLYAGGDTTICSKDTVALWALGNAGVTWRALPTTSNPLDTTLSCTNCNNPLVHPQFITDYEVTDDVCGFKEIVHIGIIKSAQPVASFSLTPQLTTMVNPTFNMVNHSINSINYYWYDFNKKLLSTSTDFSIEEDSVGHYCYMLEATNFCGDKDVHFECANIVNDGYLVVPNIFTPNGDRKNDIFKPVMIGLLNISRYSFMIYDRWGKQVFVAKNFEDGWNGRFKGNDCPSGTYFYYIETFDAYSKKLVYKGDVVILR